MSIRLASWNVNGIRACTKNGFFDWFSRENFDVVALQEVRASQDQIPVEVLEFESKGVAMHWFAATSKKGYSGVGILTRLPVEAAFLGMGAEEFDVEGRVLTVVMPQLTMVSAYFPNSQDKGRRIDYKVRFCERIHRFVEELRQEHKRPVVLAGDYNIAHEEIDLARPDDNHETAGFLPKEREWMDSFLKSGWVDTFRKLHPEEQRYSWWSARTRARERNIGWRIDYHCIAKKDEHLIVGADIQEKIMGSDHCPVTLDLNL
jgi:exodeoxyribonuclease-3